MRVAMLLIARRLFLGIFLLSATSAVLLLTDRKSGGTADPSSQLGKRWNVHVIEYVNVLDSEEALEGIRAGLKQSGLVVGQDFTFTVRNAQGDMATLNSLIQAALTDGADLLITLSTPGLQAAIRQTADVPIVFTYVADPVVAGAGTSNTDHKPNVTGVYVAGAYADVVALVRECLPRAKRIGTLFVPTEVNTVYHKDKTAAEAKKLGMELIALPAATATEVPDAAQALCGQNLDALCQVGGNLTAASFSTIAQAAQRARLPIFAFLTSQAREGAAVVVARDYFEAGRETGHVAARVMRGEAPATIPFAPIRTTKLIVNLPALRHCGLKLPDAVLQRAQEKIER